MESKHSTDYISENHKRNTDNEYADRKPKRRYRSRNFPFLPYGHSAADIKNHLEIANRLGLDLRRFIA